MLSKTASWSPTPGMDTHLSTKEGCVMKKILIILLPLVGMLAICSRWQWNGNLRNSNDIPLGY